VTLVTDATVAFAQDMMHAADADTLTAPAFTDVLHEHCRGKP